MHAVPVLSANAAKLRSPPGLVVHAEPFQSVLPRLRDVDLVFADPRFGWYRNERRILTELLHLGRDALAPSGRLVIRGERGVDLPELPSERRTYGRSWLALLEREET